ncbi:hypothetical protein [Chelativorans sp. Marseille-P2723]|uniref:hypothetical protein n=1 Tax=Chelativorans sp. Marseille-P2723 TaxID=2709133 RepID=UPI0032B2B6CE
MDADKGNAQAYQSTDREGDSAGQMREAVGKFTCSRSNRPKYVHCLFQRRQKGIANGKPDFANLVLEPLPCIFCGLRTAGELVRDRTGVFCFVGTGRDLVVTAYQSANGLVNLINPTFAVVMGALAIGRVPYERWLAFMWPLLLILSAIIMICLSVATVLA